MNVVAKRVVLVSGFVHMVIQLFLRGDLAIFNGYWGRLAIDVPQYVARLCNVPAPVSTKVPVVVEFRLHVQVAMEIFYWLDCQTA